MERWGRTKMRRAPRNTTQNAVMHITRGENIEFAVRGPSAVPRKQGVIYPPGRAYSPDALSPFGSTGWKNRERGRGAGHECGPASARLACCDCIIVLLRLLCSFVYFYDMYYIGYLTRIYTFVNIYPSSLDIRFTPSTVLRVLLRLG